ncbi:hypothetical protein SAMN05518861_114193 [Mesorhizobium sp. YR577]|nr:hypothetical protein SAMN05518861_114193 [Mesorhizobium sp. YR577]
MYQHARAFAAFVLAPPLTVAIFLSPIFGSILMSDDPLTGGFASTMPLFFIGCALAWTFAIVVGLPAYVLLRWLDIVSPWVTIAVRLNRGNRGTDFLADLRGWLESPIAQVLGRYRPLAFAKAREKALAKLSRSSGLRKLPIGTCWPWPSTAMPVMPISS